MNNSYKHGLNMELVLQSFFLAPCVPLYSMDETRSPPPPLRIWGHIRGR